VRCILLKDNAVIPSAFGSSAASVVLNSLAVYEEASDLQHVKTTEVLSSDSHGGDRYVSITRVEDGGSAFLQNVPEILPG
jgi:hypothetical protein